MKARTTALAFAVGLAAPLSAQVALRTDPAEPIRGSLARLIVTLAAEDSVAPAGSVADEPLHLARDSTGAWTSLFGIPIDGGDTLPVKLVLGGRDTMQLVVPVRPGDYTVERLRVAPRMAEPDSAARVRIARENATARRVSRGAHATPRLWRDPFLPPRASRVTSTYGTARQYNGIAVSRHLGTDFAGRTGDTVVATNRGRVALIASFYLAGRVLYLDHGDGLISAYFHLSRTLVKPGDMVERGQPIAAVGHSGRVTGPHLHWVMRYGAVTIDPASVLRLLGPSP
jgi:peptidase M23-like protein